jgi:hypothetical protein
MYQVLWGIEFWPFGIVEKHREKHREKQEKLLLDLAAGSVKRFSSLKHSPTKLRLRDST